MLYTKWPCTPIAQYKGLGVRSEIPNCYSSVQFICQFWSAASCMFLIPMGHHAFPMAFLSVLWSTQSSELSLFPDPFSQKKVTTPTSSASELWGTESLELSLFPDPFSQKKAPKKSDNTHKLCLWNQEQSICEWKWASRFSYLSMYFVQVLD